MVTAEKAFQVNWDELERSETYTYIGQVVSAEIREVPEEALEKWTTPPAEGVTPLELHLVVKPLDHEVATDMEPSDCYVYNIGFGEVGDDGTIKMKRRNSGAGKFRASIKELGFPDPTSTVGKVFKVSRGQEVYGKDKDTGKERTTYVLRFTEHFREGYTHHEELKLRDLRKANSGEETGEYEPVQAQGASAELLTDLATALNGVNVEDEDAIMGAVRGLPSVPARSGLMDMALNGDLVDYLEAQGVATVDADGIISAS